MSFIILLNQEILIVDDEILEKLFELVLILHLQVVHEDLRIEIQPVVTQIH